MNKRQRKKYGKKYPSSILSKVVTVTIRGDDGVWRPIEGSPAKMTVREMIERYGQK